MGSGAEGKGINRGLVVLVVLLVAVTGWALVTRGGGSLEEVAGPTYRVAADGDDTGPGNRDDPWSSFVHGIGAHAPSRIVVDLGGGCSLFLSDVGVDAEVADAGSVVFPLAADGGDGSANDHADWRDARFACEG